MRYDKPIIAHHSSKRNHFIIVFLMIILAACLSAALAFVWQSSAQDMPDEDSSSNSLVIAPSQPELSSSELSLNSDDFSSSTIESSSEPEPTPTATKGALPESERVPSSYFDDAVFVGDSISSGIQLYEIMQGTTVLAEKGINMGTIFTNEVVAQQDGTNITIIEALKQLSPKKIYIMLGGNEVLGTDKKTFSSRYDKVITEIKTIHPQAIIYVQSMTPVTVNNKYNITNAILDEYNGYIEELCEQLGVYYLNVAEAFKDENGALPDEASPTDGMHFGATYYSKWFDYLKTHTVMSYSID